LNTIAAVSGNFLIALCMMFVVGAISTEDIRNMVSIKKR
jgi:hypothetical protein